MYATELKKNSETKATTVPNIFNGENILSAFIIIEDKDSSYYIQPMGLRPCWGDPAS